MISNMSNTFSFLSDFSCRHVLQSNYCDWEWGCPVYPLEFLVRVYHPVPQILTQFQTKTCHFFHTHSQARALKSIPVFRTGSWVITLREMTVNERFQFQHLFASDMCSPTRETCAPLPWKHISLVICVPLPRKNISLVICVPLHRKHISLVFPSLGNTYS